MEDEQLYLKLCNWGTTNFFEWSEKIVDDLYKEKAIEEITSLDDIKNT